MFTGLFIMFILPLIVICAGSTPKIHRAELYASLYEHYPIISPPVTLSTTNTEFEIIATLEVEYYTSRTNFTHRIA